MSQLTVIFENQHYAAARMRDGSLIAWHKRKRGGLRLVGSEASTWLEAISEAMDAREANDLCRGLLNSHH